jgi:hypothetical protein
MRMSFRRSTLIAAGLFGFAIAAPQPATAVGNDPPAPAQSQSSQAPKGAKKAKKKKAPKKDEKKSEQRFLGGYKREHHRDDRNADR